MLFVSIVRQCVQLTECQSNSISTAGPKNISPCALLIQVHDVIAGNLLPSTGSVFGAFQKVQKFQFLLQITNGLMVFKSNPVNLNITGISFVD